MSALENETAGDTTTFEYFDREWTVPTKRHLSHIKQMTDGMRAGYGTIDLLIAEVFLSEDDFAALMTINPDEAQLADFTTQIADRLGLKSSGNS